MFKNLFAGLDYPQTAPPLFPFGSLKLSNKVQWLDRKGLIEPLQFVQRHIRGDWGDVRDDQRHANLDALQSDNVLISHYAITPRLLIAVVTNADRTVTVVQLPEEDLSF